MNPVETEPTIRNYENLANAIITQAAADWRIGEDCTQKEVERFFRSQLFGKLTTIDPEFLLRWLREERYKKQTHIIHK